MKDNTSDQVSRYDRKNNQESEEQEKEISLIYYKPAYFQHRLIIVFVRIQFFVHMQAPPSLVVSGLGNSLSPNFRSFFMFFFFAFLHIPENIFVKFSKKY